MLEDMLDPHEIAPERIRPISRTEYERMVGVGLFEQEHVELLHGTLIEMSPQGGHHATVCAWLSQRLTLALGMTLEIRPQLPFAADDWSEPEPDLVVARRDHSAHEHPSKALLVIEVSESSLRKDRILKARLYARAGIPEYWIVVLATMEVEVYTNPQGDGYADIQTRRDSDVLRPIQLPGVEIAIAEIPR